MFVAAAVVLLAALVTPVNVVEVTPVYVNISEFICIVPLELNPVVLSMPIMPEPVMAVDADRAADNSVDAELNIFSPRAANTKLLN